ncbi:hypothetical protein F5B19DRAFT_491994 [Rostrohypoxylon terebratum]|nr:hypothetical protein F5B19DRAFT_491994 [Rostrohypoxylon terebratum]
MAYNTEEESVMFPDTVLICGILLIGLKMNKLAFLPEALTTPPTTSGAFKQQTPESTYGTDITMGLRRTGAAISEALSSLYNSLFVDGPFVHLLRRSKRSTRRPY